MNYKFYLAHPLVARAEVRAWELATEEELPDIELFNPFYDAEREDIHRIDAGEITRYEVDAKATVERDLANLVACDGILAYIREGVAYGTPMEILHAHCMAKHVILLVTNGMEGHPWLRYYADYIFTTEDEVFDFLWELQTGMIVL